MSTHTHAEVEVGSYGLMVEFLTPEALLTATRKVVEAGYKKIDAYSPFPVHGVDEAIGAKTILPWLIFGGGLSGGVGGFLMMVVANFHYPINIAGKPLVSWPSFMPITFELTVLLASATAVFGMLFLNGLPKPYNAVFNVPGFDRASQDRFFLCIEADDPKFDLDETSRFLEGLDPHSISEVPF
jgi:Protein of unknown function (DUF3341)